MQITIPSYIDIQFLANKVGMSTNWGYLAVPDTPDMVTIEVPASYYSAIEAALLTYDVDYLAYRKNKRLEDVAAVRRVKELAGPNGLTLDDKTIARLTAASLGLLIDETRQSLNWELQRGVFVELPRNTVLQLAVGAVNKVQACFDTVKTKTIAIKAIELVDFESLDAALDALAAIDIESGWPA